MRHEIAVGLSLAMMLSGGTVFADEESGPLTGKASLGYLATSGNSDTTNVAASAQVNYDINRWHHEVGAAAIGATSETEVDLDNDGNNETVDQTTAEAYRLGYNVKYDFTEFDYIFGRLNWDKDKFSGYDQQTSETVGYGRRVLNNEAMTLNLEIGAGFKQNDLRDGTSENDAILRGAGDFIWKFSDTASFEQKVAVESGSSNTYMEAASTVKAALVGPTSLSLGYVVKRNSDVPADSAKTDTFTTIGIEYSF